MTGGFVRRVAHYPRVFLRHEEGAPDGWSFVRRVAVPPGRFILTDPRTDMPAREIPRDLLDPGVPGASITPLNPAVHIGRIEEIGDDGSCLVRVWEVPGGQAGSANVTRQQLGGAEVVVGDTLRIYTWVELPAAPDPDGKRNERPHMRIEVTPREPSLAQIEALQERIAELMRDTSA